MGLEINRLLGVGRVNQNMAISPNLNFGAVISAKNNATTDNFSSTHANRYLDEQYIKYAVASNPKIKAILKEMNAPVKLNLKELNELSINHAKATQDIASGIINNLPKGLREHVNIKSVKDAAVLHDIGKVLIPADILNKPGKLTPAEQKIMHMHSELGYEILKNSEIDTRTLNLVKYHHQNSSHSGYPEVKSDFFADINLQILSAADKFSALTEERVYKEKFDTDKALAILYKDVSNGNLHPFVFKALHDYVLASKSPKIAALESV